MILRRGTPVIICDSDAPSARMVACVYKIDHHLGGYRARYLNPWTNLTYCWSDAPTPVADFGMTVEIDPDAGEYRVVPHGNRTATYSDGKPRNWQDYGGSIGIWHRARPAAFGLLSGWLIGQMGAKPREDAA